MSLSSENGGYMTVTVAVIVITGIIGNISAEFVCRVCRITDPVARGVAIGTSSHVIGTVRAMKMGRIEGSVSALAIVVAGLLTVAAVPIAAKFIV